MGTDIYRSRDARVSVTRFWGGDLRGVCYQISEYAIEPNNTTKIKYVALTKKELCDLVRALFEKGLSQ